MFSNSLGMIVTPWVLCGEWPNIQNKATVSGVGTLLYYASVFLSSQIPPLLEPSLGLPGMFLVFAAVTLVFLGCCGKILAPKSFARNRVSVRRLVGFEPLEIQTLFFRSSLFQNSRVFHKF